MSQQRSLIVIFFLSATLTWTVHCPSQKEEPYFSNPIGVYGYLCGTTSRPLEDDFPVVYEYQDMNDGTIKWHATQPAYDPGIFGICGDSPRNESGYFKKCLQGQVYRPAFNDCQGAAGRSAVDNWGVQTFQYCPTNDRACDNYTGTTSAGYEADPSLSPAALSCAGDTTAGRTWALIRFWDETLVLPPDIRPYAPEFPLGPASIVWYDFPFLSSSSQYFYVDVTGAAQYSNSQLKDQPGYVLCMSR